MTCNKPKPATRKRAKNAKFSGLQITLSIYGLLYLLFIIDNFFSIDASDYYTPENLVVNLAFSLFLIGYYIVWKNEMIAGIIFILWWLVMWCLALFLAESDPGNAVGMGLPLFIMGILFIRSWYRKKARETMAL